MKALKYFSCSILLFFSLQIFPQEHKILIFDPNEISSPFQHTFSILSDDSVFVADTIDNSIFNYDVLFLFINYPFVLSQEEGNLLIEFTTNGNSIYIYTELEDDLSAVEFWNHIGVNEIVWLLISVLVDSVTGIDTTFTSGVVIDTSFWSGAVPVVTGNIDPILLGDASPIDVITTYISSNDTLRVIIDLYNLIDDEGFLTRVLEHFELIPPNEVSDENIFVNDFELSQNFPNPFNPTTKIKYSIPSVTLRQAQSDILVTLKVYDVLGNEIATLVSEEKLAGEYEVEFNGTALPSGIYFYLLTAGDYVETKKMVLLR